MPPAASPARAWSLSGRVASAAGGGRLDLDAPDRGLELPDGDRLLGVNLRCDCAAGEHWLRGEDVIAVYEPADPRRLRATVMWRPFSTSAAGPTVVREVTLSAQTALVQSDAAIAVTCDVASGSMFWRRAAAGTAWTAVPDHDQPPAGATCLLLRRPASTGRKASTVLVATHPADARRIVVRRESGRTVIECWLFSTTLEKGVLLRGRALAAVGPVEGDEAWAGDLVDAFNASSPPLTA